MERSIFLKRQQELGYLNDLNTNFQNYMAHVRNLQEQDSRIESTNIANMTKALEDEIVHLKNMYENELHAQRAQLEECGREKNQHQLTASQNATKVADLEEKLLDETTNRKKAENCYADAQRVIADKEKQLEEVRVTLTQEQNSHLETKKEKESLQTQLKQTQDLYNSEATARGYFENLSSQLKEKLNFDRQRFEHEICNYANRIADLEACLKAAEERIHEHNLIDEDLASQLAKVKSQSEANFHRFKEESELNYRNSLAHLKSELDSETKKLTKATEENITLKARIEELTKRVTNAEAKVANTEIQNEELIRKLETERQKAAKTIEAIEDKSRELQENLNAKIRELHAAYNASLPINVELEAMAALLDAEGRRLSISTADPPHIVTRSQFLTRADSFQPRMFQPASVVGVRPVTQRLPTSKPSGAGSVPQKVSPSASVAGDRPITSRVATPKQSGAGSPPRRVSPPASVIGERPPTSAAASPKLSGAGSPPQRTSPPASIVGVRPVTSGATNPNLSRAGSTLSKTSKPEPAVGVPPVTEGTCNSKMSRPSSVEHLPSVFDAPGRISSSKANNGLHRSLPDLPPKGVDQTWNCQAPRYNFANKGCPVYPSNTGTRKYSRYYASTQPIRPQQSMRRSHTS